MRSDREKLLPWLIKKIDSGEVPGLYWWNKDKTEFRVIWKHAGKPDFNRDTDAVLFRMWAEHTGKYKPGEQPDPSTWKTRFRCALRKQPDIVEIPIANSLDESEPYRVFRLKNTVHRSVTPCVSPANTPSPSPNDVMGMYCDPCVTYPCANDVGGSMTAYNSDYEFPFASPESSPSSSPHRTTDINDAMALNDDDLDNITPTLPPFPPRGGDVNMPTSQAFTQSDCQMMQIDSTYMTIGYNEPIRSDYIGYRGNVTYSGMFEEMTQMQQTADDAYNFGLQDQNGLATQLGFLMTMFGPSLVQEILTQQTPVNFASTTAQTYRDINYLDTMPNPVYTGKDERMGQKENLGYRQSDSRRE